MFMEGGNLSKSIIKRLVVQRGGKLDDIDWDKINKCQDCPAVQECGGMVGKCPLKVVMPDG